MKSFIFSSFKTKNLKKIISVFTYFIFFVVGGSSVLGQNNLRLKIPSDPYNNSIIWAQLQKKPLDSLLWQKYTRKKWREISLKERLQIKLWIQEIWLSKVNKNDGALVAETTIKPKDNIHLTATKVEDTDATNQDENVINSTTTQGEINTTTTQSLSKSQKINALLAKEEIKVFMKDLEELFLAESTEMEELKKNLYENFYILEAVLADEFEELGANYVFYRQKYPKGNYSESRWMMEKEQELKKLKAQKLKEMKQTFLERQIN